MERGELEVDEHRTPIGRDHDVLLLMEVVVAHADRMQLASSLLQQVKEVARQVRGPMQGKAVSERPQEHIAGSRLEPTLGWHRAQSAQDLPGHLRRARDGRHPGLTKKSQRSLLAPRQEPSDPPRAQTPSHDPANHPYGPRRGLSCGSLPRPHPRDQLDATKHIVFELLLDTYAFHGRYVTRVRRLPSPSPRLP